MQLPGGHLLLAPQRRGHQRKRDLRRKVPDSRLREQQCKGTEARKRPENELECEGLGGNEGEVMLAPDKGKPRFTKRWNCPRTVVTTEGLHVGEGGDQICLREGKHLSGCKDRNSWEWPEVGRLVAKR